MLHFRMLLRSIRHSLSRYLAIMAIVALGVGFFAGLKSSRPAMLSTADRYMRQQHFQDFQLLSTLGFTQADLSAFQNLEYIQEAEGACFADAYASISGKQAVWHFQTLTESVSIPALTAGRLPENDQECLGDNRAFSKADLGKKIHISLENDQEIKDLFRYDSFTLVGLAQSPRNISADRGTSSLGGGNPEGFVLLPKMAFDTEVYHEILLWCAFPGQIYSESYAASTAAIEDRVKSFLNERGALRYRELHEQAENELTAAREELEQGWEEYRKGEQETEAELTAARTRLENSQWELEQGRAAVDENQRKLDEAREQIPAARQEIAENRALLDEKQKELEAGRAELEAGRRELEAGQRQLDLGRLQLEGAMALALAPYTQRVALLEADIAFLEQSLASVDPEDETAAVTRAWLENRLSIQREALAAAQAELSEQASAFDGQRAELAAGQAQLDATRAELESGEAELAAGEMALAEGKEELDQAEAELDQAEASMPDNQRQLDAARAELDSGARQLDDGWRQYREGETEAQEKLAEAKQKLLDGEAALAEAEEQMNDQLQLEVFALGRSTNPGYVTFENDIGIINAIANAFPIFFVLIAALVCITTMTRMINEERTQIGTLKALGYRSGSIMAKYFLYAGSSAFLGCLLGFFLGTTAIPYVIWVVYSIMYSYSSLRFYFSPLMVGGCLLVTVLGTLLVTWAACRRELREVPADLIRPKPPTRGKRILLEYISPVWQRLSFMGKLVLRNAFRYPQRVLMMLLGIGGCTALMVAGFGAKDSVAKVAQFQYEEIFHYDAIVSFSMEEFSSEKELSALWDGETAAYALTRQEPVSLLTEGEEKTTRLVAADSASVNTLISLYDKDGSIPWPGPGEAVITRKLSEKLDLYVGDTAEILTDKGARIPVTISGVCENYLNHYVYVQTETAGEGMNNTALLQLRPETDAGRLAAGLRSTDGISYVSLTRQERDTMERSMASLDLIVMMLILCSGALAFITLYDLTNINIMERTREIATVKVLGFYPKETASYILTENLMLSILGAVIGLGLGKLLHRFVIALLDVEYLSCDLRIFPMSYVWSFGLTLVFAVLTNLLMRRRLETVNMAESLKSVE